MSKRNKIIIETTESEALKALRLESGLSLRKLAEVMNYSFARVHQMETGREDISSEYIQKFLEGIDISWSDWKNYLGERDEYYEIRLSCHELLDKVNGEKLDLVLGLLGNFCT